MNLNIEGTKHEKAVLVILSYVSGFTAGFIIFGLASAPSLRSEQIVPPPMGMSMQVAPEETPVNDADMMAAAETPTPDQSRQVLYKDGRLMANVNGASVLLSAQLNTVDPETALNFADQGVHEDIPNYSTSEDGNFIYYCEQHTTEDLCTNFIYSVDTGFIQYVSINGEKAITSTEAAKSAYWEGSTLHLDGAMSSDVTAPWKLAKAQ